MKDHITEQDLEAAEDKKQIYENSSNDSICIKHLDGSENYTDGLKQMKDEDFKKL